MGLAQKLKNLVWNDGGDYGYEPEEEYEDIREVLKNRPHRVICLKPGKYVEAGKIARAMGRGDVVVLDLEETSEEASERIIDFLSGAAYARDGQFLQISCKGYLLVPSDVEILDGERPEFGDWSYDDAFNF